MLLNNNSIFNEMANSTNPYGNGTSSKQIFKIVKEYFEK
jgi:UDP-N-acetylglucosamine 2-epimerase